MLLGCIFIKIFQSGYAVYGLLNLIKKNQSFPGLAIYMCGRAD